MDGVANWDLLLVFGVFTAVICALGWYVNTHRAPEPSPQNQAATTRYAVECERKPDGCFWAVVPALPGVLVHGGNEDEVKARVSALALRILAERLDSRETKAHTFLFQVDSESHSAKVSRPDKRENVQPIHQELERMAADTFATSESASQWLQKPHPVLDDKTPLQIAQTEEGAMRVKAVLIAIKYGGVI